ncbi:hypothetical protein HK104_011439 [Borealophlyctis nickersoniae]|nr:hypothetical protein HK104_011439 [Borealophlyctis nickersoniae]
MSVLTLVNLSQVRNHHAQPPIVVDGLTTLYALKKKIREVPDAFPASTLPNNSYTTSDLFFYDEQANRITADVQLTNATTLYCTTYNFVDEIYVKWLVSAELPRIYQTAPMSWLPELNEINEIWRVIIEEDVVSWWNLPNDVQDHLNSTYADLLHEALNPNRSLSSTTSVQTLRHVADLTDSFYQKVPYENAVKFTPPDFAEYLVMLHKTMSDFNSSFDDASSEMDFSRRLYSRVVDAFFSGVPHMTHRSSKQNVKEHSVRPDHKIERQLHGRVKMTVLLTKDSREQLTSSPHHKDWQEMVQMLKRDLNEEAHPFVPELRSFGILFGGSTAVVAMMRADVYQIRGLSRLRYLLSESPVYEMGNVVDMCEFLGRLSRIMQYAHDAHAWATQMVDRRVLVDSDEDLKTIIASAMAKSTAKKPEAVGPIWVGKVAGSRMSMKRVRAEEEGEEDSDG